MLPRMVMRQIIRTLLGLLAIGVVACGPSTTLEAGWTTPSARATPPMTRVVTVFISDSMSIRRSAEEHLARELAKKGVAATPSYAVLTDDETHALANLGRDQTPIGEATKQRLMSLGFDGIITMRIVDREKDLHYGSYGYAGWGYWGSPYWGYWDYPGNYAYTETTYRMETTAYSLRANQLVWAGLVRSVDPDTAHQLIDESSRVVAGQLAKRKLAG